MASESIKHPVVPAPSFHPLLTIFPGMEKSAFAEFVADIKTNGVREPIWIHKNQILDCRNRWLACKVLNIPCPQRAYVGKETDLLAFVISQNLHRRHLDASQRAMVAARIATMRQGARTDLQPKPNLAEVSIQDAGKLLNVSTGNVKSAKSVIAKAEPEVVRAVEQGKLAVSPAAKVAEHSPEVQRQAVAKVDEGLKGAAVVRALPASSAKAKRPTAEERRQRLEAVINIAEKKKATQAWASLFRLEEEWRDDHAGEDLWDYDASEFWPLLDSDKRDEVVRIAKQLLPWLNGIVNQVEVSKLGSKPKLVKKSAQVQ